MFLPENCSHRSAPRFGTERAPSCTRRSYITRRPDASAATSALPLRLLRAGMPPFSRLMLQDRFRAVLSLAAEVGALPQSPPENVARPCRRAVLRAAVFRVRKTSPKPGGTPISIAVLRRKTSRRQAPASPANRRVRLRPARTLPAERRASAAPVPKKAPAADLQSAQTSEPHGYSKHAERGCPFRDIPFRYSVSARRPDKPHFPQVPLRQPAARTLGSDGSFPKETGTIPGISDGPREYGKWRG